MKFITLFSLLFIFSSSQSSFARDSDVNPQTPPKESPTAEFLREKALKDAKKKKKEDDAKAKAKADAKAKAKAEAKAKAKAEAKAKEKAEVKAKLKKLENKGGAPGHGVANDAAKAKAEKIAKEIAAEEAAAEKAKNKAGYSDADRAAMNDLVKKTNEEAKKEKKKKNTVLGGKDKDERFSSAGNADFGVAKKSSSDKETLKKLIGHSKSVYKKGGAEQIDYCHSITNSTKTFNNCIAMPANHDYSCGLPDTDSIYFVRGQDGLCRKSTDKSVISDNSQAKKKEQLGVPGHELGREPAVLTGKEAK